MRNLLMLGLLAPFCLNDSAAGGTTGGAPAGSSRRQAPAAPATPGAGGADPEPRSVPYARFKEVVEERDTLKTQNEELGKLTPKVETLTGENARLREEVSLVRAGVTDPDDIDTLRLFHGKVAEDKRPKTVGEFAEALKKGELPVPKQLAHLFPAAADAGAGGGGGGGGQGTGGGDGAGRATAQTGVLAAPRKPMPKPKSPSVTPPAEGAITAETIREARQSGNMARLAELLAAYDKQRAATP